MAFTEKTEIKIEVLHSGILQVRTDSVVLRDGVEITRTYHRSSHEPGDDVSGADQRVQDVAAAVWTPDVVDAYNTRKAAQLAATMPPK